MRGHRFVITARAVTKNCFTAVIIFSILHTVIGWGPFSSLVAQDRNTQEEGASRAVADNGAKKKLILAHYMPWFVAPPNGKAWGWHWTMNAFDPEVIAKEKRSIASHFYPLIEPYDSSDQHVVECQLLQMKLAGIDGVIVDWYGLTDLNDYAILHRNTQLLFELCGRLKMRFVVCYEDQTIPALVKKGRLTEKDQVAHAIGELQWLEANWFKAPHYVRLDRKPVLLSFGQNGLNDQQWSECLNTFGDRIAYFSQHMKRTAAIGAFDWPIPNEGVLAVDRFSKKAEEWRRSIAVAFPRFVDIYEQAKLHDSYGRIEDDEGETLRLTLEKSLKSQSPIVQIATWNDWGEGTNIEPSRELGYRDLEIVQQTRKRWLDPKFKGESRDLELPVKLLGLRRRKPSDSELDSIAELIVGGSLSEARVLLEKQR